MSASPRVLRMIHGVVLLVLASIAAHAEMVPQGGPLDPRIRITEYRNDQIYRLHGAVGYHLDIEFESGESFAGLSLGDPEALIYSGHDNVLTLRPKVEALNMNLTVSTDRRRYYFLYTVAGGTPDPVNDPMMVVVRFQYPPAPPAETPVSRTERIEAAWTRARDERLRNTRYSFCGDVAIRPVEASDDGVHTRLRFSSRAELPAIFVRNSDGSESLLNFSIEESDVVIHRIAARFTLRRGKLKACVINRAFEGSGEELRSHTLAPDVQRQTRRVYP